MRGRVESDPIRLDGKLPSPRVVVPWLVWSGVVAAVVGVIDGIVMICRRREVACPDGTTFSYGASEHCYHHYQAPFGIAVVCVSLLLLIVVVLVGFIANATLPVDTASVADDEREAPQPSH